MRIEEKSSENSSLRFGPKSRLAPQIFAAIAMAAAIVAVRLAPHAANFAPVAALGLFAGFLFFRARIGLAVIIAAMLVSDFFLGFESLTMRAVVYGAFLVPVLLGAHLRRRDARSRSFGIGVFASAVGASVLFFVATNLAVFFTSGMYAKDWSGLSLCFVNALPFYRGTLAGDLAFTAVLFGGHQVALRAWLSPRARAASASEAG